MPGQMRSPDALPPEPLSGHRAAPPGYRDVSVPIESMLRPSGLAVAAALAILPLALYWARYGFKGFLPSTLSVVLVAVGMAVLLLVHEGLHAVGWVVFGRLSWRDVSFGLDRKTLSPYTHVNAPMPATAYRAGGLLPGVVTGLVPAAIGILLRSGPLTLIGAALLSGAVGDLTVLWVIRRVPGDCLVIDHPSRAGCWVQEQ
jgi:hypothetical protein